jgi:hypothetical protein
MISIMATETGSFRAFGWVQDSGSFRSLCNVVAVFDYKCTIHKHLIDTILPNLVREADGLLDLLSAMNARPLKIKYRHLVGTAFKPRKDLFFTP